MPARHRAAIIGTGRIASLLEQDPLRSKPHTHAAWYRAHPEIELVAGADIVPSRLRRFGADWNIPAAGLFSDYRRMLHDIRPDVVSICAYAPDRFEMIRESVDAGARALWIEKAIATSLREARAIRRLLQDAGVAAIVDHPRRAQPAYRAVRRLIKEQALGELESVHALMSGQLIHTGSHAWDLLHFWCGKWEGARGWLRDPGDEPALGDRGGHGHLEFAGGVQAFISGHAKSYYIFQFDLIFSDGRIQIGNDILRVLRPAASRLYSGFRELFDRPEYPLDDPHDRPMVFDLMHALESGEAPVMSVDNAVVAFETGLALFQSHRDGHRCVRPEEIDEDLRIVSV